MSETTFEHPAMVLELRGYALFQLVSEDADMGSRWVLRVPDVRVLLPRHDGVDNAGEIAD